MMSNILISTVDYIRLLKGEAGIKKKTHKIPVADLKFKVNIEFAHLKREGLSFQKSNPELIFMTIIKRRFKRRTFKVGGILPVPIHY